MAKYIDREALIEWLKRIPIIDLSDGRGLCRVIMEDDFKKAIKKMPKGIIADVEPVKRGMWGKVYKSKVTVSDGYVSSCCDMWNERRTRYCPNCGARMDLPEQAEEAYRGDQ